MTKLKFGYEQTKVLQDYQTLAFVVSQALGGSTTAEGPPSASPGVMVPKNEQELAQAMRSVFGRG